MDGERDPRHPVVRQLNGAVGDELWVKTAEEAIGILKGGRVEMISLYHDLGTGIGFRYFFGTRLIVVERWYYWYSCVGYQFLLHFGIL